MGYFVFPFVKSEFGFLVGNWSEDIQRSESSCFLPPEPSGSHPLKWLISPPSILVLYSVFSLLPPMSNDCFPLCVDALPISSRHSFRVSWLKVTGQHGNNAFKKRFINLCGYVYFYGCFACVYIYTACVSLVLKRARRDWCYSPFFFFCFWCLCVSWLSWKTPSEAQADLELWRSACLCLPSAGTKVMVLESKIQMITAALLSRALLMAVLCSPHSRIHSSPPLPFCSIFHIVS